MGQTTDWRERRRLATMEAIKQTVRQQITQDGAGSLSLGAVAQTLGMTPLAPYRCFENRDALVAALIVDLYDPMGEALEHLQRQTADASVEEGPATVSEPGESSRILPRSMSRTPFTLASRR